MKPLGDPGRGRRRRKVAQRQTWRPTYAAPYTAEGPRSGRTTNSRAHASTCHSKGVATCMGCWSICQAVCQVEMNLMEAHVDYYCRECREDMADMLRNALKRYGWNGANEETKTVVGEKMSTICIGLSGRNLADHDVFSKSDPYFTISRPSPNGAFSLVRNSETKQNTLNPDWSDIMVPEAELCGNDRDLNLRLEVYDDDGKRGPDTRDKLIGVGFFSLKHLEAANTVQSPLQITDGKKGKVRGQILVRTFKVHQRDSGGQNNYNTAPGTGYQAGGNPYPGQQQPGYPGQGYPGQNPSQGYPGQNEPMGYPGQNPPTGYPGQNPTPMPVYLGQGAPMLGYPPQNPPIPLPGYAPNYPPQLPQGYPPNPAYPPQGNAPYGAPGYPPQQPFGSSIGIPSTPWADPNGARGAATQMGFQYPPF